MTVTALLPYAQVGGTVAAAIGLFISAWQFWRNRRATTLQHLQDFFKSTNEREAALATASDFDKKLHAFVEYLNFLEIYSAAVNGGLFVGVAREIVRDKIIDSLVVLDAAPEWHSRIQKSITSEITYSHLRQFIRCHRRTFDSRKVAAAKVVRDTAS